MKVKSKVWLEKNGKLVFGRGKCLILKAIGQTGSINRAAQQLKMSYRHAWSYIRSAEKRFGKTLIIKTRGGKSGGGALLTEEAKDLLKRFEIFEQQVQRYADKQYKQLFKTGE